MALTSQIKKWIISILPGMNNKVDELDLQQKFVSIAQNGRFEDVVGSFTKRLPISYYNSSSKGTGPIVGLYRYYSESGGAGTSVMVHGTKAYVGNDSAGTWTQIRDNLTDGKRTSFVTYNDMVIAGNAYDNIWCFDGSDDVTWELGACKAVLASGGTNLDSGATYSYKITIDSDAYICGAVSNTVTTDASNRKVTLSHIPLGPSGTADRKIYRTVGGGSTYKLLATVSDNSTTTYTDDIADGSLGGNLGAVTDDVPKGNLLQLHRERLFISGNTTYPNRIYYSNVYIPGYIQQTTNTDYMEIEPEDGDEIMGIPIQLGLMCCIKKNSIRKLHITSAVSGSQPSTWYSDDPIAFVGARSKWSICQTMYGVLLLGWDSWYLFDGASAKPIVDEFDTANISDAQYNETFAYSTQTGMVLACYTDVTIGTNYHNRIMRYNLKRKKLSYDTITANVISQNTGDDEDGTLFYGDSQNGYVYRDTIDYTYELKDKDEADNGDKNNTYVGGTKESPYIEIGSETSATAIPDDICIFWDQEAEDPGSGWTEITSLDGKFVKIKDVSPTTGTIGTTVSPSDQISTAATSITVQTYRLFKKNSTTTEYVFPEGAIVLWDQDSPPVGWIEEPSGRYIMIDSTSVGYNSNYYVWSASESGTAEGLDNYIKSNLLKKVGEQSTWDGVSEYIYALYYTDGSPTGFTDVSSTYDGNYLKSYDGDMATNDGGDTEYDIDLCQLPNTDIVYNRDETETTDGLDDTWPGSNAIDGDDATYYGAYYRDANPNRGPNTTIIDYATFSFPRPKDITSIDYKLYSYAEATGNYICDVDVEVKVQYSTDNGSNWNTVSGTNASDSAYDGGGADQSVNVTSSGTWSGSLTDVTDVRTYVKSHALASGGIHSANKIYTRTYTIKIDSSYPYATFNLSKKVLGKMQAWSSALTSAETNGIWISPGLQFEPSELKYLYWNEDKESADDIEYFINVGSTESSVEDWTSCTADNANNQIDDNAHGLSNGDRVCLSAATIPTGLSEEIMYYVVNKNTNDFQVSLTSGGSAVTFSDAGTTVTYKNFANGPYTLPNGADLSGITVDDWIQYAIVFTAADTTADNPQVYTTDGYAVKMNYEKGENYAEDTVEYVYEIGLKNFDLPEIDKIFKKIVAVHEGSKGSYTIYWKTDISGTDDLGNKYNEYDSDTSGDKSFIIDLTEYPERWDSFFPDIAYGRSINFKIYKNDQNNFEFKELAGLYEPRPVII